MRRLFILFLWLASLPIVTRGQTVGDADLSELLQPIQAASLYYWYDDDANRQTVSTISGTYSLDVASLSDGIHTIHYQVVGADGGLYDTKSRVFLKLTDAYGLTDINLEGCKLKYWFDTDAGNIQTVNSLSGIYTLDVASLSDGLHTLHYMVLDANGTVCSIMTEVFYKMESVLSDDILGYAVTATNIAYWFDNDATTMQTSNGISGIYVLDVSTLSDGLHTLHYHVVGDDGSVYGTTTRMFLKNEAQHEQPTSNGIVKYTYWINNSCGQTITLDEAVNPYTLMTLLPVQTQPIRSSSFHFQIDDGIPTIYAKNDFRIRFYDARGEFVDNFFENERSFIDYGVSQQVTDMEWLESGVETTTEKPTENTIKWYYLNAEPGDSLEFKLDRAATIQLFAPSGEEVYNASGGESVKWGGCHVNGAGSYYLAIHDVTAMSGNTVTVNYNHIDKYAILGYDVNEIGVAESFVPITIQGNGFDKLKSVKLCLNGNTITATDYVVVNKGKAISFFHFSGEEQLGDYTLTVEYDDPEEGVVTLNAGGQVHLVSPEWGELKVDVFSSMVTLSKTYVNIRVTNQGNVARLYTPLTFSYDRPGNVSQINFENFFVAVNNESQEDTDRHIVWTDDFVGAGEEAESMFLFIPSIKPKETVTLSMSCHLSSDVYMSAVAGKSLNKEAVDAKNHVGGSQEGGDAEECTISPSLFDYLMEHTDYSASYEQDPLEDYKMSTLSDFEKHLVKLVKDVQEITNNAIGIGRIIANIQNSIQLHHNLRVMELSDYYTEEDKKNLINSVHLETPSDILNDAGHPIIGGASAVWEWQQLKTKCNKDSRHGVFVPVWKSFDPNDIIGYTAESGSKSVKNGQTDVYYTIECENDPEIATASAHTVVVTDILDALLYDLSTFAATGITIGDKQMAIDHEKSFSKRTMDLRPTVNVIAQISLAYNEQTGVAKWTFESLDPMTMEPTEDALQGVLPVNTDGSGIGQVSFDIALKDGLAHGTEVPNQATIVFDTNEPILTPVWTNVIDRIAPESHITNVEQVGDSDTATVSIEATDDGSGPWRYDVYVQYGTGAWFLAAENVPVNSTATVKLYSDIEHHFYAVATDMAGNVEAKEPVSEFTMNVGTVIIKGDANGDGKVNISDAVAIVNYILGNPSASFHEAAADVNNDGKVTISDAVGVVNMILSGN